MIRRLQLRGQPRHWGNSPHRIPSLIPSGNRHDHLDGSRDRSQSRHLSARAGTPFVRGALVPRCSPCKSFAAMDDRMSLQTVTANATAAARRRAGVMAGLMILVVLLVLVSLGIGAVRLSPLTVVDALVGGGSDVAQVIVREIRLPRTILALAIGGILGLSGAALQGLL